MKQDSNTGGTNSIAMVFERTPRRAVPRLLGPGGEPLRPDGKQFLTLDQAAAAYGIPPAELAADYRTTYAGLLPEGELVAGNEEAKSASAAGELVVPAAGIPDGSAALEQLAVGYTPAERLRLAVTHAFRYPHLTNEQFAFFADWCRQRKVNPNSAQVFADLKWDARLDAQVVVPMLGIEGFRLLATRTDAYAGCDAPTFTYADPADESRPSRARCTVRRIVKGTMCPSTAEVRWEEYATTDDPEEFRDQMPHVWLGKCAEAAALRKAFPDQLGGIYAREEMTRVFARQGSGFGVQGSGDSQKSDPGLAGPLGGRVPEPDEPIYSELSPDEIAEIEQEIHQRLSALGLQDQHRTHAMKTMRKRWPGLVTHNLREFGKKLVEEVARNPSAWGARRVPA